MGSTVASERTVAVARPRTAGRRAGADRPGGLMDDIGTRVSTLWVVVMFTMVFADILSFIKPGALQGPGFHATPGMLLAFAILLEIPIAMIFVSRVLRPRAGLWANGAAALVTTVFVVAGGMADLYSVFFAAVEIACMALIVRSTWSSYRAEAAAPQLEEAR